MQENLNDLESCNQWFFTYEYNTKCIKEITDKLDLIKMKNLYSEKYTVKKMKRQVTDREEIVAQMHI